MKRRLGPILLVVLLLAVVATRTRHGAAVSVVDHHPDDGYVILHQVTRDKALAEARHLEIYPGPSPGCKPCTSDEMNYCRNGSVIQDHCCCPGDNPNEDVLRFVEHTCGYGPVGCQIVAGDCAEYARLRECCCHNHLASHWKYLAGDANSTRVSYFLLSFAVLLQIFSMNLT